MLSIQTRFVNFSFKIIFEQHKVCNIITRCAPANERKIFHTFFSETFTISSHCSIWTKQNSKFVLTRAWRTKLEGSQFLFIFFFFKEGALNPAYPRNQAPDTYQMYTKGFLFSFQEHVYSQDAPHPVSNAQISG